MVGHFKFSKRCKFSPTHTHITISPTTTPNRREHEWDMIHVGAQRGTHIPGMLAQKNMFFCCFHQSEVFSQNNYKHISIIYMLLLMSAIYILHWHCVLRVFARTTWGQSLPKETTTFVNACSELATRHGCGRVAIL